MSGVNPALPVSRAKNAYQLLGEIRKLILEEPKRYRQSIWGHRNLKGPDAPACGTQACVAGWTCVLKVPSLSLDDGATVNYLQVPHVIAQTILGITDNQADVLFSGDAAGTRMNESGLGFDFEGHARRGARHIARFMKMHAKRLKATKV